MAQRSVHADGRGQRGPLGRAERVQGGLVLPAGPAGLAAAVGDCWFLIVRPLGARLDPTRAFVSELSVPGQPFSALFRGADALVGALIVVFALGLRSWLGRRGGRSRWRCEVGCALLVAVGAFSILDAAHPMSCAPSVDAACDHAERARPLLAQLTDLHTASGVAATLAASAAMVLLGGEAARRAQAPWLRALSAIWSTALLVLGGLVGLLDALGVPGAGAAERVQILLLSSWLAVLAALLIAGRGRVRRDPDGGSSTRTEANGPPPSGPATAPAQDRSFSVRRREDPIPAGLNPARPVREAQG